MDFLNGPDYGIYYWLVNHPTPGLQPVMVQLAVLGGPSVLALVVLLVAALLLALRRYRLTVFVLAAVLVGVAVAEGLRALLDRPAPSEATADWLNQPVAPQGFPGGSAMSAAVVYLTLALVLAPRLPRRGPRMVVLGAGFLLAFLTGVSRFYLGLHFLSDMLAAWVAGLAWALLSRGVISDQ
jgi:undecaprenyl-diphosphatase